jgi:hypothetical protein
MTATTAKMQNINKQTLSRRNFFSVLAAGTASLVFRPVFAAAKAFTPRDPEDYSDGFLHYTFRVLKPGHVLVIDGGEGSGSSRLARELVARWSQINRCANIHTTAAYDFESIQRQMSEPNPPKLVVFDGGHFFAEKWHFGYPTNDFILSTIELAKQSNTIFIVVSGDPTKKGSPALRFF